MSNEKQYSIEQLSKLTGISITTLCYYDKEGILIPEIRNEKTGYRYYSVSQLAQAQIVRDLKSLGISLDKIKAILSEQSRDHLEACFLEKIRAIEYEKNLLESKLLSIQNAYHRLTGGRSFFDTISDIPNWKSQNYYPVDIMPLKEMWVLSTRYPSILNANILFSERCLELQRLRSAHNLFPIGSYIAIFHDGYQPQFSNTQGDLEVCLPVIKPSGVNIKELRHFGGILTASTIHIGPYKTMEQTYQYLEKWISTNNYEITGPPVEYYLMDISNTFREEQYITKIHFPVMEKMGG